MQETHLHFKRLVNHDPLKKKTQHQAINSSSNNNRTTLQIDFVQENIFISELFLIALSLDANQWFTNSSKYQFKPG